MNSSDDPRGVPDDVRTDSVRIPNRRRLINTDTVAVIDEAVIVTTQAFCPVGHALIAPDNPRFGGNPGLRLEVKAGDRTDEVILSPIHGHHARKGASFEDGTECEVRCPTCHNALEAFGPCACRQGTLRTIYLTEKREEAHIVLICDVWGCQRSRIVDDWEILSEYME